MDLYLRSTENPSVELDFCSVVVAVHIICLLSVFVNPLVSAHRHTGAHPFAAALL